ncbi:MAG: O-antigen ligase family protein [Bacteroidota bacterium]
MSPLKLTKKRSFSDKSIFYSYILGGFIIILSFIHSDLTIDPVLIPRFTALAVFLSAVLLIFSIQQLRGIANIDLNILRRGIFPVFICYFIFSACSLFNAINVTEGIFEVLKIFLFILFLFVATQMITGYKPAGKNNTLRAPGENNIDGVMIIIKSVIAVALIISIVGLYQYYELLQSDQDISEILIDVRSTLANKNLLSSAIFLTLPFIIYGVIKLKKNWKLFSLFTLNLSLFNIVLLQSRAVWVATGISAGVALLLILIFSKQLMVIKLFKGHRRKSIIQAILLLVVVNTCLITLFINAETKKLLRSRWESIIGSDNLNVDEFNKRTEPGAIGTRLIMWKKTIQMIKENPLTGVGAGNWKINLPLYGIDDLGLSVKTGIRHYQRPHNDFLWILSEIGIIGFLFYLLAFMLVFKYIFKLLISAPNKDERWLALLIFFGITGYLILSFFSFARERIMHNVILMISIAVIVSMYHNNFPLKQKSSSSLSLMFIIPLLILSFVSILIGFTRANSESHAKQAITAHAGQRWNYLIPEINKAYSRWYNMDPMATPLTWYRGVANFTLNHHEAAFNDFLSAYKIHPYHIHNLNNLATCYELKGEHDRAIEFYKKALAISPRFEESLINLSAVYFNQEKIDDAYLTISACDTNTVNPKFKKYLATILSAKIDVLLLSVERHNVKQALIDISNDEELLLQIHKNALSETTDISSYLLKEAVKTLTILERRE